ncbi:hypothetical protein [Variovorax soli]|uniref:hypothetical protein n=1 Tax=Variovorax soli TaxID=376815 RepID=UPI0012948789|nr:hypothetical protein [Variovorax soli]
MQSKKVLAAAAFVIATNLAAADAVVVGAGASVKCGDWLADRSTSGRVTRAMFASHWIQGFLSGINTERLAQKARPQFDVPSHDVLNAMLDKHCRNDPLQSVWEASMDIASELTERSAIPAK